MSNTILEHRVVRLEDVRQNNVVIVDLEKASSKALFGPEYKKAAKIIRNIIKKNDSVYGMAPGCGHCELYDHHEESDVDINLTQFHSTVSFIGDRGTGKTSVMQSILRMLRKHNCCTTPPNSVFSLGEDNKKVRFTTFKMIDANILTGTEDIMEIILSRMLQCLQEKKDPERYREIFRQIDELYKDLNLAYGGNSEKRERSLFGLQQTADSQRTIESFKTLIFEFNKAMESQFLVLALDDIDIYRGNPVRKNGCADAQFTLLEHIYNHLRVPGLIVLMTFNERVLKNSCDRHFAKIYCGIGDLKKLSHEELQEVHKLSNQFLSKLLPQEQRIYLPDFNNMLSTNQNHMYICPTLGSGKEEKVIVPFETEEEIPVKAFMLRLIADRTGVFFDAAGTKQHFFEPRNLRELGELAQFVLDMEDIPQGNQKGNDYRNEEENENEAVRSRNRQTLLDYLNNQFVNTYLDTKEFEQFRTLSALPTHRRNKTLIDWIHNLRKDLIRGEKGYLEPADSNRWSYSYGELLHNLYFSTRISKGAFSKRFVQSYLGMNSIMLCQTSSSQDYRDKMLDEIGSSIAGRWANKMLPRMQITDIDSAVVAEGDVGSISVPVRYYFGWKIPPKVMDNIVSLFGKTPKTEDLSKFLKALVLSRMFFTKEPKKGFGLFLDVAINVKNMDDTALETKETELGFNLLSDVDDENACYNVMNFAVNLLDVRTEQAIERDFLAKVKHELERLGETFTEQLSMPWEYVYDETFEELEEIKLQLAEIRSNTEKFRKIRAQQYILEEKARKARLWYTFNSRLQVSYNNCQEIHKLFRSRWNEIVNNAVIFYRTSIKKWSEASDRKNIALPIHQFDMMYNIIKRCANREYYDMPETIPMDDLVTYYGILYKNIVKELEKQDDVYCQEKEQNDPIRFANVLRESVFFKIITAEEQKFNKKYYNPYIEFVLKHMMASAIVPNSARERVKIYD